MLGQPMAGALQLQPLHRPAPNQFDLDTAAGIRAEKNDLISTAAAVKDAITERLLFGGLD
jgi:hypothetical protein